MPRPITAASAIDIAAPIGVVFDVARGSDLPAIFRPRGAFPGIMKVDEHRGPWSAAGEVRLLRLSDGTSVREELTDFVQDRSFVYRVSGFTGPFAALLAEGRGEWHFTAAGPAATHVDWTYALTPKGALAGPAVWFLVHFLWPSYQRAALARIRDVAESAGAAA
jgi:hypothetical protein